VNAAFRGFALLLGLAWSLSACGTDPLPAAGVWRSTETPDPIMGVAQTPDTTHLYEFNFATAGVSGWHYACSADWTACAPKGYGLALSGALLTGTGDFSFTYLPAFGLTVKVRITGTFSTGGFVGRFEKTSSTGSYTPVKGNVTMVWVSTQR
jgi:hypothetical protein